MDQIIAQICGGFAGIFIGALFIWLVLHPALSYHETGFWWIAFIKENPPKGYRYFHTPPHWRKVDK